MFKTSYKVINLTLLSIEYNTGDLEVTTVLAHTQQNRDNKIELFQIFQDWKTLLILDLIAYIYATFSPEKDIAYWFD